MLKKFITYCKSSYEELAEKTTWPNRRELTHTAIVVLVASFIIALIVFAEDSVFKFVMEAVYHNA